jgi:hypothetical protein
MKLYTEKEAKKKECPVRLYFLRMADKSFGMVGTCSASDCMMWVEYSAKKGRCGFIKGMQDGK